METKFNGSEYPLEKSLDIGCGRGIVTEFLFKKGILIEGVQLGITSPINNSKVPISYGINEF